MKARDGLLAALRQAQGISGTNWLGPEARASLRRDFGLTKAGLRGVASYYSMLSLEPRGRHLVRLCVSPVCRMAGSVDLLAFLEEETGVPAGGTDPTGSFSLETVQCLGRCASAPAMMIDDRVFGPLDPETALGMVMALKADRLKPGPDLARAERLAPGSMAEPIALRFSGLADPCDLGGYVAAGGFAGLRAALSMGDGANGSAEGRAEAIRAELTRATVRGRGGAGFPAGIKESSTAGSSCEESCERYVVCNADEGEPGTFKDRIIMESSPLLLIEGMTVAALSIEARRGYIYVRGEYGPSMDRLGRALAAARAGGYLGEDILGSGASFDLELRTGAGSYLCGEELTLIESLEGKRGYPRIKPPFPAESGLWGRPTLVNNVETIAALPWIIEHGADAWLSRGRPTSPGTKIFCLSGDFLWPGYGEWELGVALGDLVAAGGGLCRADGLSCGDGEEAVAFLLGGAAGSFVPGTALGLAMDYDALKAGVPGLSETTSAWDAMGQVKRAAGIP